jgi:hypothetical protein
MDWKVGAVLAIAALVLITAFFSGGINLPAINTGGVSGFFTAFSAGSAKNVTVDTALDLAPFEISTKADYIEVELLAPSSEITVGNSLVDLSSRTTVKMIVQGWNGKITLNRSLSLDGTADEIIIDGIKLTPVDKTSKLTFSDLGYADLSVRGVNLNSFAFTKANGYVYVDGGKTTVRVDDEPFEFRSFSGDINTDTSLRLSGTAGSLLVSGKNVVSVQ